MYRGARVYHRETASRFSSRCSFCFVPVNPSRRVRRLANLSSYNYFYTDSFDRETKHKFLPRRENTRQNNYYFNANYYLFSTFSPIICSYCLFGRGTREITLSRSRWNSPKYRNVGFPLFRAKDQLTPRHLRSRNRRLVVHARFTKLNYSFDRETWKQNGTKQNDILTLLNSLARNDGITIRLNVRWDQVHGRRVFCQVFNNVQMNSYFHDYIR